MCVPRFEALLFVSESKLTFFSFAPLDLTAWHPLFSRTLPERSFQKIRQPLDKFDGSHHSKTRFRISFAAHLKHATTAFRTVEIYLPYGSLSPRILEYFAYPTFQLSVAVLVFRKRTPRTLYESFYQAVPCTSMQALEGSFHRTAL
jgi:hypothetical protein